MAYSQGAINKKGLFYLKDKKAMIYRKESTQDKYGNWIDKYRPITPAALWCYTRQLTQEQIFGAAQYYEKETRIFVFNYRDGMTATSAYICYNGAWYEVTRVDVPEDYKGGEMFIYVTDIRAIPNKDLLPYESN